MISYVARVGSLVAWHALTGKPADGNEPFRIKMRAWPWYCDAYLHMNNASYLRVAEDARWAWLAKTRLLKRSLSERWLWLLGGADLIFRREIPLMSPFEVVSQVIGADQRWLYVSQEFVLPDGKMAGRLLIREMVRSRKGLISPEEVAAAGGLVIPNAGEDVEHLRTIGESQLAVVNARSAAAAH
jgi:acyl-CoA thioesterase FadM